MVGLHTAFTDSLEGEEEGKGEGSHGGTSGSHRLQQLSCLSLWAVEGESRVKVMGASEEGAGRVGEYTVRSLQIAPLLFPPSSTFLDSF